MEIYCFNLIDREGQLLSGRQSLCADLWQAEAAARIFLLSRGTQAVEAWSDGRLCYRVERS